MITKTHSATRVAKGHYVYRGYTIKSFDQKYLLDPELRSIVWDVYEPENNNAIEIADSLGDAKSYVNDLLKED